MKFQVLTVILLSSTQALKCKPKTPTGYSAAENKEPVAYSPAENKETPAKAIETTNPKPSPPEAPYPEKTPKAAPGSCPEALFPIPKNTPLYKKTDVYVETCSLALQNYQGSKRPSQIAPGVFLGDHSDDENAPFGPVSKYGPNVKLGPRSHYSGEGECKFITSDYMPTQPTFDFNAPENQIPEIEPPVAGLKFNPNWKDPEDTAKIVNFFCDKNHLPRGMSNAMPKCDPSDPNSPGMVEFMQRQVDQIRKLAGLGPIKFYDCLQRSSRVASEFRFHDGFGASKEQCGKCGGAAEGAFGPSLEQKWWARVGPCQAMASGHRGPYIDPGTKHIGYWARFNSVPNYFWPKGSLSLKVQYC